MTQPHQAQDASHDTASSSHDRVSSPLTLVIALCLVGINLRPMLTSLGPVLDSVQRGLNLGGTATGLLITLLILCFGAFAPFVPRLLRYRSAERLIFYGLLLQAVGIAVRSLFGTTGLFVGTLIGGASISVVMVLLPSLIKRSFPAQASTMMGLYSAALCLGAAVAAGATVPIEDIPGSNWQWALAFWLVPVLIAAAIWFPHMKRAPHTTVQSTRPAPRLLKNPLAWQVTLFMGCQSAVAYCVFGWMPVILIDRGLSALTAGFVISLCLIVQLPTSLIAPWMGTRGKDQRSTIFIFFACNGLGLTGLFYGPLSWVWVSSTILGLGLGGMFSIALALLVLRAPDATVAASLSGMAQGGGYTVAAIGPLIVGLLHDYFNDWHTSAAFFAFLALLSLIFGMGAGRSRYIKAD